MHPPELNRGVRQRRLMKQITAGLATVALFTLLTGCNRGDSSASGNGGMEIALLLSNSSGYTNVMADGAKQFAAENGGSVQTFSADFDAAKQLQQCQDAVATGKFDLLVVDPVIGSAIAPCVSAAKAAGITFGSVGVPIGPQYSSTDIQTPGVAVQVTQPIDQDGAAAGELIVGACGNLNPCKVAYLLGEPSFVYSPEREKAVRKYLADHPNVQIVATGTAGLGQPDLGYSAAKTVLLTNPDVNVIANDDDVSAVGIQRALAEASLTGKVQIVSGGGSKEGFDAVKSGSWYGTVLYLPRTATVETLKLMKQVLDGQKPEKVSLTYADLSPTKGIVVDQETINRLTPEWSQSS